MMRMMRVPAPRYTGFSLFKSWLRLPAVEKLHSLAGTWKRTVLCGWTRPLKPIVKPDGSHEANDPESPVMNLDECESQCKA
jgi:hypothetical protein